MQYGKLILSFATFVRHATSWFFQLSRPGVRIKCELLNEIVTAGEHHR